MTERFDGDSSSSFLSFGTDGSKFLVGGGEIDLASTSLFLYLTALTVIGYDVYLYESLVLKG